MIKNAPRLMHHKFSIIDDNVISGSYNWTFYANTNYENIIITDEHKVVDNYVDEYNKLQSLADAIKKPYYHLSWLDINEKDFVEKRRDLYRDLRARKEYDKDIIKEKLKKINNAIQNKDIQTLTYLSKLPTSKIKTIQNLLITDYKRYELSLWEENSMGQEITDNDYTEFGRWIFMPTGKNENQKDYIEGGLYFYSDYIEATSSKPLFKLKVFDNELINIIHENSTRIRAIENLLIIDNAKICTYYFPSPLCRKNNNSNCTRKEVKGINLFAIAKTISGNEVEYYDGWIPNIKGMKIQNAFFRNKDF